MKLNSNQLLEINGGAITSSMINAISKAASVLYNFGKQTGSSIRRIIGGAICPIK